MSDQFAEQVAMGERAERRAAATREQLLLRIAGEFREMAGLSLTARQASRLFALDADHCSRILDDLVRRGILKRSEEGLFMRGE